MRDYSQAHVCMNREGEGGREREWPHARGTLVHQAVRAEGGGYYALESRIHSVAAVTALGSDDDTDDDVDDALSHSLPSSAGCTRKVHIDSLRIE